VSLATKLTLTLLGMCLGGALALSLHFWTEADAGGARGENPPRTKGAKSPPRGWLEGAR
jgi:hypothetical protein